MDSYELGKNGCIAFQMTYKHVPGNAIMWIDLVFLQGNAQYFFMNMRKTSLSYRN